MSPRRRREAETDAIGDENNDHHKKQKTKIVVFDGITDDERRQLRAEQRVLHQQLLSNSNTADLDALHETTNRQFKKVAYPREAVLDVDNCHLLAKQYVQQAQENVKVSDVKSYVCASV